MKHLSFAIPIALTLQLSACDSTPPPPAPPPGVLQITISAEADINPNVDDRPSPLTLTLYQLSAKGAFGVGDYFEIEGGKQIARDIVARDQVTINPGDHEATTQRVKDATAFLGVVASFQRIDNAAWRSVIAIPQHGTTNVSIHVAGTAISVQSDALKY